MIYNSAQTKVNRQGFTLIEIILVFMILAVIVGISAPNFKNTFQQLQLKKTAEDIVYLMRYAQSRAITKNTLIQLNFDESINAYWLMQLSETGELERFRSRLGRDNPLADGIAVESDESTVNFYADGSIEKHRFYVCDKKDKCFTISTQEQRGTVNLYEGKIL